MEEVVKRLDLKQPFNREKTTLEDIWPFFVQANCIQKKKNNKRNAESKERKKGKLLLLVLLKERKNRSHTGSLLYHLPVKLTYTGGTSKIYFSSWESETYLTF